MTSFVKIENKLLALKIEKEIIVKEYETNLKTIENQIKEVELNKKLAMSRYDIDMINLAKSIMYVDGLRYASYNEAVQAICDAIKKVAINSTYLVERYIGCKNYAGWTCQREDHLYGYGPKHGSIVFKIGYKNPRRLLEINEAEACIYWLNLLLDKNYVAIERENGEI